MSSDATDPVKALREWCGFDAETARDAVDFIVNDEMRKYERDGDDEYARCHAAARALLSAASALLARIEAGEGLLAAMQARAEVLVVELDGSNKRAKLLLDAKNEWADRARDAEAKLAALESRLAEAAPVVEAAERQEDANEAHANWTGEPDDDSCDELHGAWVKACCATDEAVRALRTARSLRGAGEQT